MEFQNSPYVVEISCKRQKGKFGKMKNMGEERTEGERRENKSEKIGMFAILQRNTWVCMSVNISHGISGQKSKHKRDFVEQENIRSQRREAEDNMRTYEYSAPGG